MIQCCVYSFHNSITKRKICKDILSVCSSLLTTVKVVVEFTVIVDEIKKEASQAYIKILQNNNNNNN